ncbi:MAG: hypothetical protein IKU98_01540, partial [Bacteroidaceae bacterium]|nr:hypothetical protein [Bacteroidaceae bacterium]
KYCITNEGTWAGKKFLTEDANGKLKYASVTNLEKLATDDAFAWYFKYEPTTGMYRIRNAKSGKYFTYNYDFRTKEVSELTDKENMHLMPSRKMCSFFLGFTRESVTVKSYWIARGNRVETPEVLDANFSNSGLDFYDTAISQRWAFLPIDEVQDLVSNVTEVLNEDVLSSEVEGYYDISGNRLTRPNNKGVTIVKYMDGHAEKLIKK